MSFPLLPQCQPPRLHLTLELSLVFLPPHRPRDLSQVSLSLPLFLFLSLSSLCQASPAAPVTLWGLSVSSSVPRWSPCWFLGSVSLFSAHFPVSGVLPRLPTPLPASLARHLPWVVRAPLLSPGTHPQGRLGWKPGLGAVTRPGRGTQADMIFMLGLQSGAEPEAGLWGGGGRKGEEGSEQKPD